MTKNVAQHRECTVLRGIFSSCVFQPSCRIRSLPTRDGMEYSCETSATDYFTVLCLVAWPLNESEAGVDLVLIETSLLFLC